MRKNYLDNIRSSVIWIVVVYHIIYLFNNVGVISNLAVKGIPQFDVFLSFVYPWFMVLLFVVAGMSARYALEKHTNKEFMKSRAKKLLIPSIGIVFLIGWSSGYITLSQVGMFEGEGAALPGFVKYLICSISGIGPLWFIHELFIASFVLVIIRLIDKKGKLYELGDKVNLLIAILLFLPVWGSSMILNTPMISIYRNGIYIFTFLLGYYVFSHEKIQEQLMKAKIPLLVSAIVLGVFYVVYEYGQNYTTDACLQSAFTNLYLWIAVLAILGCARAWFNQSNKLLAYMKRSSFGIYLLHYPILVVSGYLLTTYTSIPIALVYVVQLLVAFIIVPLLYEGLHRIPVVKLLLFGE